MASGGRKAPPLYIIVTVLMVGSAGWSLLQAVVSGLLLGWDSTATAVRLWASCILWLSTGAFFLTMVSLLAPRESTLPQKTRIAAAVVHVPALGVLIWLTATGRAELAILGLGVLFVVVGWSGSFGVRRLMLRAATPQ